MMDKQSSASDMEGQQDKRISIIRDSGENNFESVRRELQESLWRKMNMGTINKGRESLWRKMSMRWYIITVVIFLSMLTSMILLTSSLSDSYTIGKKEVSVQQGNKIETFKTEKDELMQQLSTSSKDHHELSGKNLKHNIVVLDDDRSVWDEVSYNFSGLDGVDCECAVQWVSEKNFAEVNWKHTGVVIFHVNSVKRLHRLLDRVPADVVKIVYWRELYYPNIAPELQDKFDVIMGTGFNDAVLNPSHFFNGFQDEILPFAERPWADRNHFALHLSSRCSDDVYDGFRAKFIEKLGEKIDIEVQGGCGTKDYDLKVPRFNAAHSERKEFYSNYKFYIAVENTGSNDYVTEKIMQGLGSGAIPVYLGASDMDDFPKLDGKSEWFINARDFETVDALAEFLIDLASDEEKFNKYLEWHKYALSGGEYMPDAADNMKETFAFPYRPPIPRRIAAICKLCNLEYLQEIKERKKVLKRKVGYPNSWEIDHTYTEKSGVIYIRVGKGKEKHLEIIYKED